MYIGAARLAELALATDDQILRGLDQRTRNEFEAMVEVLYHLIEFDRRALHVPLARHRGGSLFAYAVKRLLYSEGSAQRRISAARAIHKFPVVHEALLSRKLSLTSIAILSSSFTDDQKAAELVAKAEGKTQEQVRALAAAEKPGSSRTEDRIVPEAVLVPAPRPSSIPGLEPPPPVPASGAHEEPPADRAPEPPVPSPSKPVVMERFKFVFSVGPAFKQKFDRVRTLLSGKYPAGASCEDVLGEALDEFIERYAPERRAARRDERMARASQRKQAKPDRPADPAEAPPDEASELSRAIPRAFRDAIFVRDGGRCTYVAPDGTRCDSTWDLEIDHETPVAKDGKTTAANCRLDEERTTSMRPVSSSGTRSSIEPSRRAGLAGATMAVESMGHLHEWRCRPKPPHGVQGVSPCWGAGGNAPRGVPESTASCQVSGGVSTRSAEEAWRLPVASGPGTPIEKGDPNDDPTS